MTVEPCQPRKELDLVFSGLDATVAGEIEHRFAQHGIPVISNAKTHRMDSDVPLVIPEINPGHLDLVLSQPTWFSHKGFIVTNPNCSTIALSLALAPVVCSFGVQEVMVTTLQALSGAGYPGVSALDILDNVLPFISGEIGKIESEPLKIFGTMENGSIVPADMRVSAQCNRVNVKEGHLISISVKLKNSALLNAVMEAILQFSAPDSITQLPSSPRKTIIYQEENDRPQPVMDRMRGRGMTVTLCQLRPCPILDYRFVALGHNTIRGAAGGSILTAELLVQRGMINADRKR